jgi:purine-binding chemotaxis protein CheW
MLVCRTGGVLCALPLWRVRETMRALPFEAVRGAPEFVLGAAVIRGESTPVVDCALLLGGSRSRAARFVSVKAGNRAVALAVDGVLGIRALPPECLSGLPPLLSGVAASVNAIAALDNELLFVLQAAQLVPEAVWAELENGASAQ